MAEAKSRYPACGKKRRSVAFGTRRNHKPRQKSFAGRVAQPYMSAEFSIPDGLTEIRDDLPLLAKIIARSARWVHPDAFYSLPVWCPDTARGRLRYKAKWLQPLVSGHGVPKLEENIPAANAFVSALD